MCNLISTRIRNARAFRNIYFGPERVHFSNYFHDFDFNVFFFFFMKGRETRIFAFGYRLTFKSRDNTANTLVFCKYIIFKSKKKKTDYLPLFTKNQYFYIRNAYFIFGSRQIIAFIHQTSLYISRKIHFLNFLVREFPPRH